MDVIFLSTLWGRLTKEKKKVKKGGVGDFQNYLLLVFFSAKVGRCTAETKNAFFSFSFFNLSLFTIFSIHGRYSVTREYTRGCPGKAYN